jgi:hypothetical protein
MAEPFTPPPMVRQDSPLVDPAVKQVRVQLFVLGFMRSCRNKGMLLGRNALDHGYLLSSSSTRFGVRDLWMKRNHVAFAGPGLLAIPIVYQQCGWFPTTLALFFFMVVSCFSATLLCEAISCVPRNQHFDKRIEFTTAVKYFYGRRWHAVFQVLHPQCT